MAGVRNRSGIVLVAVVAFVVVVSTMILGVLSRNISHALLVERQVRHIQAEQLRKGAMWVAKAQVDRNDPDNLLPKPITESLGKGTDFSIYFSSLPDNAVSIEVKY